MPPGAYSKSGWLRYNSVSEGNTYRSVRTVEQALLLLWARIFNIIIAIVLDKIICTWVSHIRNTAELHHIPETPLSTHSGPE